MTIEQIVFSGLTTTPYIDIHCHQARSEDALEIVNQDISQTHTSSGKYFSAGLHPWFIKSEMADQIISISNQSGLLAIGECGLDKTISIPMERQIVVFEKQIIIAEQLNKPLIIHCVKAFNELLAIKKRYFKSSLPWLIHGYQAKPAQTLQLLKQDCYFSFGAALLKPNSYARQSLQLLPAERFFLETDAAEQIRIEQVYAVAAKIRQLEVPELKQQMVANFKRVFLHE